MPTTRTPRRFITLALAGVAAVTTTAQSGEPVTRLLTPREIDDPVTTARGAPTTEPAGKPPAPNTKSLFGFGDPYPPFNTGTTPPAPVPASPAVAAIETPKATGIGGAFKNAGGWLTTQAKDLKNAVVGTPKVQPPPRVGTAGPALAPPTGSPVFAGKPAFHWYGWGTTTPGQNVFAPSGEYPQASGSWFTQSGATPGAFPMPVTNPFRPAPNHETPVYVISSPSPPPPLVPMSAPPVSRPVPQPTRLIAQTAPYKPVSIPAPVVTPAPALVPSPSAVPVPPPPSVFNVSPLSKAMPAPPVITPADAWLPAAARMPATNAPVIADPAWKPTEAKPELIIPVVRGQQPDSGLPPAIDLLIREACRGLVSAVEIADAGPNRVIVTVTATTETLSGIAARAVAALPELKPYAVEFKAKVGR